MSGRKQLLIYGASSFVGRLASLEVARLLFEKHIENPKSFSWALGGRNEEKLKGIRREIIARFGADFDDVPIEVADCDDEEALYKLASSYKCIISSVGPYTSRGSKLVRACAEKGAHYADLTGELKWVRQMEQKYAESAEQSGAKMVSLAAWESLPPDVVLYQLAKKAAEENDPLREVEIAARVLKGTPGVSGGTIQSVLLIVKEGLDLPSANDWGVKPLVSFPSLPSWSGLTKTWTSRSPLAECDEVMLNRSVQKWTDEPELDHPLAGGKAFEGVKNIKVGVANPSFGQALGFSLAPLFLGFLWVLSKIPLLGDWALGAIGKAFPHGSGPPEEQMKGCSWEVRGRATTESGRKLETALKGSHDPGYWDTANFFVSTGLALALDDTPKTAGFLTPTTAAGDALLKRLQDCGLELEEVKEEGGKSEEKEEKKDDNANDEEANEKEDGNEKEEPEEKSPEDKKQD